MLEYCLVELSVVINESLRINIAAMSHDYPAGTVLLETRLLRGEISYKNRDIVNDRLNGTLKIKYLV